MASKTSTTEDVSSDFNPSSVEGVSVPPIPKRLGVSDSRKFARRIGNPFGSNDSTNDREMVSVSGKVKIVRSGYYVVNSSVDLNVSGWTTYDFNINVNGVSVRQCYMSSAYWFTRNAVTASYFWYLNSWDLISLTYTAWGSVGNTLGTFIEVLEIS